MNQCNFLYISATTILCLFLFLNGYFPLKTFNSKDFVDKKHAFEFQRPPTFQRIVIMVIDGLRNDFLENKENMPYLSQTLELNKSCWFSTKVETPTVTMPRIKALTMGSVPSFLDVIFNLGSFTKTEDSIIHQSVESGLKLTFFGDNTWLKLFPQMFVRSEGTTSFFVKDYTEVDNNVTRHLPVELKNNDWNIMILHYLGLDHIGHIEGPYSSLIGPKLREMDNIVQLIHESLMQWELETKHRTLLLITGDHGMKNSGGHGGSTYEEITVPFVALGSSCGGRSNTTIAQIDIAPTLAILLGINFPSTSIGKLIPDLLKNVNGNLATIYRTYFNHLRKIIAKHASITLQNEIDTIYNSIDMRIYEPQTLGSSSNLMANNLFLQCIAKMSDYLVSTRVSFDFYTLVITTLLLASLLIPLCVKPKRIHDLSVREAYGIILGICFFYGCHLIICEFFCYNSHLCLLNSLLYDIEQITIALIFTINISYILRFHNFRVMRVEHSKVLPFLVIGTVVHIFSLFATSFIEEEHQTWYFLTMTLLMTLTFSEYFKFNSKLKTQFIQCISLLVIHRFLRKLNKAGVEYHKLPAISTFLNNSENKAYLSLFLIIGLISLSYLIEEKWRKQKWFYFLVNIYLICVYLYRSAIDEVEFPYIFKKDSINSMVHTSFVLLLLLFIYSVGKSLYQNNGKNIMSSILFGWILLTVMVLKPHNVIIIPALIATSRVVCNEMKTCVCSKSLAHIWLANTFYFYQGNTNSLASVDVTQGYIGQSSFNPVVVGCLMFVHTYATYILSILLLITNDISTSKLNDRRSHTNSMFVIIIIQKLLVVFVYYIVMMLNHSHLFIWSVFSPKLIYESSHMLVTVIFVFVINIIVGKVNNTY